MCTWAVTYLVVKTKASLLEITLWGAFVADAVMVYFVASGIAGHAL